MWLANNMDFFSPSVHSPRLESLKSRYLGNVSVSWSRRQLIGARYNSQGKVKTTTRPDPFLYKQERSQPFKDCLCHAQYVDALVSVARFFDSYSWSVASSTHYKAHRAATFVCRCGCSPAPCFFRGFFSPPPRIGSFVLLILLECSSYHHLDEFITLLPSVLPRPVRLGNKRVIVLGAAPWIQVCWHRVTTHPIFPIIKREGEKLIMHPSPREWEEKSLQERRLRPPAIKSSYSKAKALRGGGGWQQVHKSIFVMCLHEARATDQYSGKKTG